MTNLKTAFAAPICAAFLSSCEHPSFMKIPEQGPPEYQAGWNDGCDSGLATYGTMFDKLGHSFYQNYSMLNNNYYVAAWHEGFDYCRHYNLKWNTQNF